MKLQKVQKLKLKPAPPSFLERLKGALPKVVNLDDYRGRRGRRGSRGAQGEAGKQGIPGTVAFRGDQGDQGAQGERGLRGYKGGQGRAGEVGKQGPQGEKGDTGSAPAHEWQGNALRFKKPSGVWGKLVNLQGPAGGRGASGRGAKEQFSAIELNGTSLDFLKQGALGPDISVELSGLAVGGVWGSITGDIVNQTDLNAELSQTRTMRYFLGE